MVRAMNELISQLGSSIASLMFIWAIFRSYFPLHLLQGSIDRLSDRLLSLFNPYIQIRFQEFSRDSFWRNEAYNAIENYLGSKSANQAKRLKGNIDRNSKSVVLSMDDHEEVSDQFQGIKVVWSLVKDVRTTQSSFSLYPATQEKRYYKLTFHMRHREIITESYLKYVVEEGQAIAFRNRQRRLYTNNLSLHSDGAWSHVVFEHPGSFETMALDQKKKEEIMEDLTTFSKARDYYAKIGKAWKRGYLIYGPPGTGKSTMIAAISNFLKYDVYDLELTAVRTNTELRKLLIETTSKSIIVIEDIDCSLELSGQRKKKAQKDGGKDETEHPIKKEEEEEAERQNNKVTLSGLLNFIDGIWSSTGGERLIIFTTNHPEKLDPALIRRGRMDKHIELSYCSFEAFKVLAENYLNIKSHPLYIAIAHLLEDICMTPADVAENLMPKTIKVDAQTCLERLIQALETAKQESTSIKAPAREESSAKERVVAEKEPLAEQEKLK